MKVLIGILLFALYIVIGRVIVKALNKAGHIDNYTLEFMIFVPYLFLPITLFVVGINIATDWAFKLFNLND